MSGSMNPALLMVASLLINYLRMYFSLTQSLRRASDISRSKVHINTAPSAISTAISRNEISGRGDPKRKILLDGRSHACRGRAGMITISFTDVKKPQPTLGTLIRYISVSQHMSISI